MPPQSNWTSAKMLKEAKAFICGFCGENVGTDRGFEDSLGGAMICICPVCTKPTYFDASGKQIPGASAVQDVPHVPATVESAYREARDCMTVSAYTACAMICRKILMNVAVNKGANGNGSFIQYVDYLAENVVGPSNRAWVDRIRTIGNAGAHELEQIGEANARSILRFVEMVLRLVYEYPAEAATGA